MLLAGQSLPASMCELALNIMQQMQTSLKSDILRNSIGEFSQPPASYTFFRSSILIDAIKKETHDFRITFEILEENTSIPIGCRKIPG